MSQTAAHSHSMTWFHIFLAILVALIFGLNSIIVKIGMQEMNPVMYTAWRYIIVWPLLFFIPKPKISWQDFARVSLALGATGSLAALMLYVGVSAGIATVLTNIQVFFTILLSIWIWNEWPRTASWIGMGVSFVGVVLIALRLECGSSLVGILVTIIASLSWALGNIALRKAKAGHMLHIIAWVSVAIPVPLILVSLLFYGPEQTFINPIGTMSLAGSILFSGIMSGLVGISLTGFLFKHYTAAAVGPFSFLTPVSGLIFAHMILDEHLSWLSFIGCVFVLAGLAINQWKIKPKTARTTTDTNSQMKLD